jgi:hypothetical protein
MATVRPWLAAAVGWGDGLRFTHTRDVKFDHKLGIAYLEPPQKHPVCPAQRPLEPERRIELLTYALRVRCSAV